MKKFRDILDAATRPLQLPAELEAKRQEQLQGKISNAEEILKGIPVQVTVSDVKVIGTADGTFKKVLVPSDRKDFSGTLVVALNDFQSVCREHAMRVFQEEV